MRCASREQEHEQLRNQLETYPYLDHLRRLCRRNSALRRFESWGALGVALWSDGATEESRDTLLRPMLRAHARDRGPLWRSILLFLFWRKLVALSRIYRRWDLESPDNVWVTLVAAFFDAADEAATIGRVQGLARRVLWQTRDRARNAFRREWRWHRRRVRTVPHGGTIDTLVDDADIMSRGDIDGPRRRSGSRRDRALQSVEEGLDRDRVAGALAACLEAGLITRAEHAVLLGAFVHGSSLKEECYRLSLPYEAIRKRIQRSRPTLRRRVRELLQ